MLTCKVNDFALESQCGGLLGRGTDFASQPPRLFLQAARCRSWSASVLFLDLSAAFDSVTRELIMGAKTSPLQLHGNLPRLGLDQDVISAMINYVQEGDVLQRAEVSAELSGRCTACAPHLVQLARVSARCRHCGILPMLSWWQTCRGVLPSSWSAAGISGSA